MLGLLVTLGLLAFQLPSKDGDGVPPASEWIVDARTLRSLSMDLLGRPPLRAEVAQRTDKPAAALLDALVGAPEFWNHWLEEQLYYFLLVNNFRPESERIQAIPADLAARKLDVREAIHLIALSSNFDQRNPGADTFVTVVLEQLDGIEVQKNARELDIGKKLYDGRQGVFLGSAGNSQADVVRIAVTNTAFARHFVGREYERLVHRKPDAKELVTSATDFSKDPASYPILVRRWLASDAYRNRLEQRVPASNRLFVRALFVDLFDRMPAAEESEPMREALDGLSDPTPLRAILVRMLLDSGQVAVDRRADIKDAGEWIGRQFRRLLCRAPTDSELATFVVALQQPDCRPETILCAILASAEYQRY